MDVSSGEDLPGHSGGGQFDDVRKRREYRLSGASWIVVAGAVALLFH